MLGVPKASLTLREGRANQQGPLCITNWKTLMPKVHLIRGHREPLLFQPLGASPSFSSHLILPIHMVGKATRRRVKARGERPHALQEKRTLGRGCLLLALRLMPPQYLVFQWQTIKLKVSITSALSLRFASLLSIHHTLALLQPIAADLHQLLIY